MASRSLIAGGLWMRTASARTPRISWTITTSGTQASFFQSLVSQALIRGWEITVRSPRFAPIAARFTWRTQIKSREGSGTDHRRILTDFVIFAGTFSARPRPAKHTERGWRIESSVAVVCFGERLLWLGIHATAFPGAPFPGNYLPAHTTFDLSAGKDFGERFTASVTALNVANRRYELDNSLTFGGFHWNDPREIYVANSIPGSIIKRH